MLKGKKKYNLIGRKRRITGKESKKCGMDLNILNLFIAVRPDSK